MGDVRWMKHAEGIALAGDARSEEIRTSSRRCRVAGGPWTSQQRTTDWSTAPFATTLQRPRPNGRCASCYGAVGEATVGGESLADSDEHRALLCRRRRCTCFCVLFVVRDVRAHSRKAIARACACDVGASFGCPLDGALLWRYHPLFASFVLNLTSLKYMAAILPRVGAPLVVKAQG